MLQCYICHKSIKRHEYNRHVASHLTGNVTGANPWPDPTLPAFTNDSFNYNHPATALPAHSTPLRTRASDPQEHADNRHHASLTLFHAPYHAAVSYHAPSQDIPEGQPKLNAFQIWRKHYVPNFPKYTTIDGGKSDSGLEVRQAAEVLRSTTKEEIVKIVKDFKGFSSNDDQRTCLELVQKVPIFPVG